MIMGTSTESTQSTQLRKPRYHHLLTVLHCNGRRIATDPITLCGVQIKGGETYPEEHYKNTAQSVLCETCKIERENWGI